MSNIKHGLYNTKLYRVRLEMIKRCNNPLADNYKYYGKRNIKVCDEWLKNPKSFLDWALANGYKEGLELDRINNNGNYEPNNCHFITHKENCAIGKRRLSYLNKSGYRNIIKTRFNTYESYGYKNGQQKFLGTFKNIKDAIKERDKYEELQNNRQQI